MKMKTIVGAELTAELLYRGMSDYWGGNSDRWEDDNGCLFAFYAGKTTWGDLVEEWVSDYWGGGDCDSLPSDVSGDDVRAALLEELASYGYDLSALCDGAENYDDANALTECPDCGDELPDPDDSDECTNCGHVFDDDDDCMGESPIWVVLLRYTPPAWDGDVTVAPDELTDNGYSAMLDDDGKPGVRIRRVDGGVDVFAVRDSYSGWCLNTEDGRVLEFCYSIAREGSDYEGGDGRDLLDVVEEEGY